MLTYLVQIVIRICFSFKVFFVHLIEFIISLSICVWCVKGGTIHTYRAHIRLMVIYSLTEKQTCTVFISRVYRTRTNVKWNQYLLVLVGEFANYGNYDCQNNRVI